MKKSSCEILQKHYPEISDVEDLQSTSIANCVFNNFLSYTAIMLKIVTIHAIRKTSSLPKTLKTLLLGLAVSDLGVGLFVQPFYTSLLVKWLHQNIPNCRTYNVFLIMSTLFATASFLAIHLHLRYQELVTHKRFVAVGILMWILSLILSLMSFWVPLDIISLFQGIIIVVGLILTTLVYIRIHLVVRRHKNQIQVLQIQQVAQTGEMASFASLVKSAVGIFYVCLVFLACYLPCFISMTLHHGLSSLLVRKRFTSTILNFKL